ncbi:hypothetical protein Patl1_34275 [Pistacia atlantica]|uniref:Uncharacterized protein n=1 Tax=Pistacia atlantica TaxID=434234 RepID=A0ACC0ZQR6_9ROSI|nr:hypothetical protein Patl1_34275 [Pistacia atlantica]
MEFVDASLLRFCELKFCMQKFRLYISILDVEESAPYIEKWIGLAIEKEVKEFDLQFLKEPYTLPQTIFSARSVTTLKTLSLFQYSSQIPDKLFESFYNEWKNRDLSCCSSHDIKCWRHYLKDIKFESFLGSYDGKLIDADKLMKLRCIYPWYTLPGGTIKCQLDWCFPLSLEKA